jgi:hypothetical protein
MNLRWSSARSQSKTHESMTGLTRSQSLGGIPMRGLCTAFYRSYRNSVVIFSDTDMT